MKKEICQKQPWSEFKQDWHTPPGNGQQALLVHTEHDRSAPWGRDLHHKAPAG